MIKFNDFNIILLCNSCYEKEGLNKNSKLFHIFLKPYTRYRNCFYEHKTFGSLESHQVRKMRNYTNTIVIIYSILKFLRMYRILEHLRNESSQSQRYLLGKNNTVFMYTLKLIKTEKALQYSYINLGSNRLAS